MKRSDLDTGTVLTAVARHFPCAMEHLAERFPPKVVLAAFLREVNADRLDYGTALTRPFLTDHGRQWLAENVDTADVSGWRPVGAVDDRPGPPFATGGVVRGPGSKDDDRIPFPLTGCMFADVARVFVLPRREGRDQ